MTRNYRARIAATLLCLTLLAATSARAQSDSCDGDGAWGIILHGGTARAGNVPQERLDLMKGLLTDLRNDIAGGASALDSVEKAIITMEDSGLFNAGKGAIANAGGFVETDASIMDGATLNAGAVGSMRALKNPINAARLVMDETRHVMMVGDRGETAVTGLGAETVSPASYFINNRTADEPAEHGTVGAAALDRCGNLAAGTSTGGYDAKIPGRVGDSPVIGAGTYARNGVMAASATGHGEYFIRFAATRSTAARMQYGGETLDEAAAATIEEMAAAGGGGSGRGGLIAIDADGNFAYPFSTEGMVRGYASPDVVWSVGVFGEMETATAH